MKKIPTIMIGIPAYNEQENVSRLLKSLVKQKVISGVVKRIIVISDGSNDDTVKRARSINSPKIKIIDQKQRIGMNATENVLLSLAKEDILVLMNADVLPASPDTLEALIRPMVKDDQVGICGGDTSPIKAKNLIEKFVNHGHLYKQELFRSINRGNNFFLCHGRFRAFSKQFYSTLILPTDSPEDGYSYLSCIQKGFTFVYVQDSTVLFRSPQTLIDHARQSIRFIYGNESYKKYFSSEFVRKHCSLSFSQILFFAIKRFFEYPVGMSGYVLLMILTRIKYRNEDINLRYWNTSLTSKKLIYE
jgi:cellulose synthase/poly-beta-1,6-N-acetylglucosamine synthase-like glycosyltransferase